MSVRPTGLCEQKMPTQLPENLDRGMTLATVIRKYLTAFTASPTVIFEAGDSARLSGHDLSPARLFRVGY